MLKGIHLTLMIGPMVPQPVPYEVIEALTEITVTSSTSGRSGFELNFQLSTRSPLHTMFLLVGGGGLPILRVVITVTVNGMPTVLMDGVVTNHQVSNGETGKAALKVIGEDLTRLMDFQDLSGFPFPALPVFGRVALLLAKYAPLGVLPKVIPNISAFVDNPADRIPRQKGTDYQYIQDLASRSGYVFYLNPGPTPGISTAYWGPTIKYGQPQPALTTNMDAHNNVESLSMEFKADKATLPIAMIQEPITKVPIPIPVGNISPLNPPLGLIPPIPRSVMLLKETAKLKFAQAAELALAISSRSQDCIFARGSLNVVRYGRLLEPRKLVGVRGVGTAYDGVYYVEEVTHRLKRGEYKQDFVLSRNAFVSATPRIPA